MRICSLRRELEIVEADGAAWKALAPFHYRSSHPGAISRVFAIAGERQLSPVGVIVYAMPTLNCRMRNFITDNRYCGSDRSAGARLLNRELRRISRVVIHPAWRGIGLGCWLVRETLPRAGTKYVEALAAMGRVHPIFEKAGMQRHDPAACQKAESLQRLFEACGLDLTHLDHEEICGAINRLSAPKRDRILSALNRQVSRYGRYGRKIRNDPEQMVRYLQTHLTLQPVYYFWKREN